MFSSVPEKNQKKQANILEYSPDFKMKKLEPRKLLDHPLTQDITLLQLREGIRKFSVKLYDKMHDYCDPITNESNDPNRGALYGSFKSEGSVLWNAMMSTGPIAGFVAAYLYKTEEIAAYWQLDDGASIRGTFPKGYSTSNNISEEILRCKEALAQIQVCFSVLFNALDEDCRNPKRQATIDKIRRQEFASWAITKIRELDNLISKISDEVRKADSALDKNDKNIKDISLLAQMPSETREKIDQYNQKGILAYVYTRRTSRCEQGRMQNLKTIGNSISQDTFFPSDGSQKI